MAAWSAFYSEASDLVAGDGNAAGDVFLRDRVSGTTTLVSATAGGAPGNGQSTYPVLSADGRWLAFDFERLRPGSRRRQPEGGYLPAGAGTGGRLLQALPAGSGATWVSASPLLDWQDSLGATGYEYCYDTTDDDACATWVSTGAASQAQLGGLSDNTTYYWQVRAVHGGSTTYANGSSTDFWSFTPNSTPPLGSFGKLAPANGRDGRRREPDPELGPQQWGGELRILLLHPLHLILLELDQRRDQLPV